jgi:ribosomal protein S18 acetylase RimI-like enzyme
MVSILSEAFEADEPSFAPLLRLLEPGIREVFTAMLAYTEDDEPVATAGVFVSGGGAMIANVATRASWRRRGIGTEVTAAAVRAGFDAGAGFAWLAASPDGVGPYRTLGFEPVCTMHLHAAP